MWYTLTNSEHIISPSLLFYRDRIKDNIASMVKMAGSPERLIPHVKTHKTNEIVELQLDAGITKFKCATIAEAETIALAGGKWILIAYQLVGPNINRLFALRSLYPGVTFASLVDNTETALLLNETSAAKDLISHIFIDVNNGMNRSGHTTDEEILGLYRTISKLSNLKLAGIHIYDGHIRDPKFDDRKSHSDRAFESVAPLLDMARQGHGNDLVIVAGGSPTFNVHALQDDIYLSPGTNVLWDYGYGDRFQDQPFLHAALILTRVVSKPAKGIITIDLGHKAVAAENSIENRFRILNLTDYTVVGQSEEHGVLNVTDEVWKNTNIGEVLYALPYHICPTVALHDFAFVIENGKLVEEWKIVARNRRLTV